jgi:hypothetical protein
MERLGKIKKIQLPNGNRIRDLPASSIAIIIIINIHLCNPVSELILALKRLNYFYVIYKILCSYLTGTTLRYRHRDKPIPVVWVETRCSLWRSHEKQNIQNMNCAY